MYKKPIRLPSIYMLILCSMHINCQLLDTLLKKSSCSQLEGLGLEQGAACHPPGPH